MCRFLGVASQSLALCRRRLMCRFGSGQKAVSMLSSSSCRTIPCVQHRGMSSIDVLDSASSARNIAGWKPDPGERPPNFPEEYWRSLATSQVVGIDLTQMSKDIDSFRKRLAWACKNRGWAEMGKLLDDFFTLHKDSFSSEDLQLLHRILLGMSITYFHLVNSSSITIFIQGALICLSM